jgi:hypothetical protein
MKTELARLSEIPATINPRSRVHADRGLGIFHINAITRAGAGWVLLLYPRKYNWLQTSKFSI